MQGRPQVRVFAKVKGAPPEKPLKKRKAPPLGKKNKDREWKKKKKGAVSFKGGRFGRKRTKICVLRRSLEKHQTGIVWEGGRQAGRGVLAESSQVKVLSRVGLRKKRCE